MYTVSLAQCCACKVCAGEMLGEADYAEFPTLREAVDHYEYLRDQIGDGIDHVDEEPSSCPHEASRWWSAVALNHKLGCDGEGREVLTLSLPIDTMTPSSLWRVNKMLAKRWGY